MESEPSGYRSAWICVWGSGKTLDDAAIRKIALLVERVDPALLPPQERCPDSRAQRVGRQLLLLLKRFDESGTRTNHFRGEAATPANVAQIRKLMALDELNE